MLQKGCADVVISSLRSRLRTRSLGASTTRFCFQTFSRSPSTSFVGQADVRALAFGKTETQVREELGAESSNEALVKSKIFEGNKPTNSIMFQKLNPATLGSLVAMYEHKIHVQGAIWGINSYDQMGVELGKVLAKAILGQLGSEGDVKGHDSSVSWRWGGANVDYRFDSLLPKEQKVDCLECILSMSKLVL